MVYRSSRRPPSNEDEANLQETFSIESDESKETKFFQQQGIWKTISILLSIICVGFLIGIVIQARQISETKSENATPLCGKTSNSVQRVLDLSEPENPGPFDDLTQKEIKNIISFLKEDPNVKLKDLENPKHGEALLYTMEVYPAKKAQVQKYLSGKAKQPDRQARVILFRSDLNPPMIHELLCGPLPKVTNCPMLQSSSRRNPIEYSMRPLTFPMDVNDIFVTFTQKIDKQIGHILRESYGMSYANCEPDGCLRAYPAPIGTNIVGKSTARGMWLSALYPVEYYSMHIVDFIMLVNLDSLDPNEFFIEKVWYHGQLFDTLDDFIKGYENNSIKKSVMRPPSSNPEDSPSSLFLRGKPYPEKPQRPPTIIEPDGRRYSIKHREVDYLGWKFNFRMSPLHGPSLHNIRFRGDRIAYELAIAEISVLYSSFNPMQRMTDYADSGVMLGMCSRSLIQGADCPDTAVYINQTFSSQTTNDKALVIKNAWCVFENNHGYPARRHLSASKSEGQFYGGMLDSALTLRTILTVVNYDYVVDFIFYQTGAVETRVMSTGYILPAFYHENETPYGFLLSKDVLGPIHHHMFHFKADLDISGTSNRYETLDIKPDTVKLRTPKSKDYHQTRFDRSLKRTEKEALFKFNFEEPKYHIVHNDAERTDLNQIKGYRIQMRGMSKQLLRDNANNEGTVSWGRHQLVATKHKDDEITSSSPYAFYDSINPVTNFSKFYDDNEAIVDEDLVFWITSGIHHIPHTEDLPITPTIGNALSFFLTPYNYFPYCPSFNSRDHIRIQMKEKNNIKQGVKIDRNGYKDEQCKTLPLATEYEELLRREPDVAVDMNMKDTYFSV